MSAVHRFDDYQKRHRWLGMPIAVLYKFVDDQGGYLASLITYYGFLSLFPLLLIFSTALGFALPGNPELQQQLIQSALSQFPIIGDQLTSSAQPLRGSGAGLVVGIVVALYGSVGVAVAIQNAFDQVWGVPIARRPDPIRARVRSLLPLLLFGLGVLLTTALSALGTAAENLWPALRVGAIALSVATNCVLFVLAFRTLTTREVGIRDVLPGAITAALGWQVLQSVGALYVGYQLQGTGAVYGLFGIVLGLLAWIYLEALIIVLAAELNVVVAERLWPRALMTMFVNDVELTQADRRSYESYAKAQQYVNTERVDVDFAPPRAGNAESPTAPPGKDDAADQSCGPSTL